MNLYVVCNNCEIEKEAQTYKQFLKHAKTCVCSNIVCPLECATEIVSTEQAKVHINECPKKVYENLLIDDKPNGLRILYIGEHFDGMMEGFGIAKCSTGD